MKTPYLILIFLILDIACFAQPMSGTYAVGGPQGDFATPALAVQQLQQRGMNGSVILKIHPGTYWGQFFINNIPGSSLQNKLTIESESGNNNDVILTYNMQDYSSAYLIWIGDIENLEINNITFEPTGSFSISLKSYGSASTLEVFGCVFRSCTCKENIAEASIIGGVADTLILRNNTFIGCKPLKISSHYTIINNNFFYQSQYEVIQGGGYHCVFSNNTIYSDHGGGFVWDRSDNQYATTFLAHNNIIILKGHWGALFWLGDQTAVFRNNSFMADSAAGIFSEGEGALSMYYNTIKVQRATIGYIDKANELKNNILVATDGPLFGAVSTFSTVNSDYNVFHSPTNSPLCTYTDTNVLSINDFASWQNLGMDSHTQWGIPLFSKPYDLHLQPGDTLALGKGIPLSLFTYDFDGDPRDMQHPDIGFDEATIRPVLDSSYNACSDSPYTLDAGSGFDSYHWSTGGISQWMTIPPSSGSANYTCTVTYGSITGQKTTMVKWVDCTGIPQQEKAIQDICIFPNPATRTLTLKSSEGNTLPEGFFTVYDLRGIRYMTVPISVHQTSCQIDISLLPPGIYLGRIENRTGYNRSIRFTKTR